MTSTQQQIEAAQLTKWIGELKWKSVDKDNMEFEVRMTCYVRDALLKWAALTAAVEVGSLKQDFAGLLNDEFLHPPTIERCVQVAEEHIKALRDGKEKLRSINQHAMAEMAQIRIEALEALAAAIRAMGNRT